MIAEMISFQPALPQWQEKHLRFAIDRAGIAFWMWNVDTDELLLDAPACKLWGIEETNHVTFEDLSFRIHPCDRGRVRAAFNASRALIGAYEVDFRIVIKNEVHWVCARSKGGEQGMAGRTAFGIFLDVTGRKQAEESNELLAGEMSHRVKNLLAIASGLTSITSRSSDSAQDMAQQLINRLAALGRAHDLVRPLPGHPGKGALLGDLLSVLLAPYDDLGAFSGRIRVSVPRMAVGETAATTLSMVVHELATNSLKYGALSSATGTLDLSASSAGDEIMLVWTERGGPPVSTPASHEGYGSKLINRAVSDQLDGSITCDWASEGLAVTLIVNKHRLAA